MNSTTRTKPTSRLKSHAAEVAKTIDEHRQPILITQNGETQMAAMDIRSYEEHEKTLALLKVLAMGNQQIEAGQYRPANEVFADLDDEAKAKPDR